MGLRERKFIITTATMLVIAGYCIENQGCALGGAVSGYTTKVNFSGQVVDATSGDPIKGATVNVTPPNSDKHLSIRTDDLGYFQVQNMAIGKIGGFGGGSSGGLATVRIDHVGYKPFANKYPIESLPSIGSAMTTSNIGTINLQRTDETSGE